MANSQPDPASSGLDNSESDWFGIFLQAISFDRFVQNTALVGSGLRSDQMVIIVYDEIMMFGLVIEFESVIGKV